VFWLLVALVPGLLMLVTLGLGRLEKGLAHDTVTATDVAEFLEHAEAIDVRTLAREGMPEALDYLHRRQAERIIDIPVRNSAAGKHHADPFFTGAFTAVEPSLPTRRHKHSQTNPQFKPTRHVDRV
jgi:hypothetical protein